MCKSRARLLSVLCACVFSTAHAAEPSIVGDWAEDENYGGKRTIALGHFHADGTFSVDFRTCLKQGSLDRTDTGHWFYANGKLRMTTETQGGFWTYDIEDYQTLSNNGRLWIYKSVSGEAFQQYGQITFHDVRVTPDSKAPSCDLTS